jgi:hypothetical protein
LIGQHRKIKVSARLQNLIDEKLLFGEFRVNNSKQRRLLKEKTNDVLSIPQEYPSPAYFNENTNKYAHQRYPMIVRPDRNELSYSGLIYDDVWEVDTWPYNPSETLKQALQTDCMSPDELLRLKDEEYRQVGECANQFYEKQKTAIGWILAATIGVLGNLAVTLGFGPFSLGGNLAAMLVVLVILLSLVFVYFFFLQKVSIILKFIGPNVNFPLGYEKYFDQAENSNPHSSTILESGNLGEVTTSFGSLVRTALLKRYLNPILDKATGIKISDIRDVRSNLSFYFIEFSTKNIRIWADPHGKERIEKELKDIVDAMLKARQMCSAYGFELDPQEWNQRGPRFIDIVSAWKMDEAQSAIIEQMRPKPSRSVRVYRAISKKQSTRNNKPNH